MSTRNVQRARLRSSDSGSAKLLSILLAIAVVPASWVGLAALGFPVAGVHIFDKDEQAPKPKPAAQIQRVDYSKTPAADLFRSTLADLDKAWNPSPIEVDAAGLPHPLDCVTPAPALSNSKAYEASGSAVQVTLAAYPAGLGGEMFKRFETGVYDCKPATTSVYGYDSAGIGVEAETFQVAWSNNSIRTTVFRRGDVVAFVATDGGVDSQGYATAVDQTLSRLMTPAVCINQNAGAKEVLRNALAAGKNFKGKGEKYALTTEKLPKPELTPEQQAQGVQAVNMPGAPLKMPNVTRPSDDYPYPLWPLLPREQEKPTLPKMPKPQKLNSDARIRVPDLQGPGCGWAFLTTVQPTYNTGEVEASNEAIIDKAQEILDADGPRWQRAVRQYWTGYNDYVNAVIDYREYADEVQAVAEAWEVIHEAWSQYYTDYANWEIYDDARNAFIAEKEQARTDWKQAKIDCKTYEQELQAYPAQEQAYQQELTAYNAAMVQYEEDLQTYRELKNDDDPTNDIPKPTKPTKPTEPTPPQEPAYGCPAERPSILDEEPPAKKPAPAQPADPRPVGERD